MQENFKPIDGIFWHDCEEQGCSNRVEYDDEPFCFTHSADDGSSVPGYSAYEESMRRAKWKK